MKKSDLLEIIQHNIKARPLKQYIKENLDSKYKGTKEADHLKFLNDQLDILGLKKIIFSQFEYFALDVLALHVDDPASEFTKETLKELLSNQVSIDLNETGLADSSETWKESLKVFFFTKANYEFYRCDDKGEQLTGEDENGESLSKIKKAKFYVPTCIEFLPPRTVKYMFGKLKISKGIRTQSDTKFAYITKLTFNVEQIAAVLSIEVVSPLLASTLTPTCLDKSIKKFASEKRISASDFGWKDADGKKCERHSGTDSTLFNYSYINNRIQDALDILPAKWYMTDPARGAAGQKITELEYLNVHSSFGLIKTGRYVEDSLQDFINEFINEAH